MNCEFLSKAQRCFLTKNACEEKDYKLCKYYGRQFTEDKELFNSRFRKALKKALKRRDVYNEYKDLAEKTTPDYSKSIYANVTDVIANLEPIEVILKEKREITKEDLKGNILKNITENLYNYIPIKILQKDIMSKLQEKSSHSHFFYFSLNIYILYYYKVKIFERVWN